jgi:hypothetical protein
LKSLYKISKRKPGEEVTASTSSGKPPPDNPPKPTRRRQRSAPPKPSRKPEDAEQTVQQTTAQQQEGIPSPEPKRGRPKTRAIAIETKQAAQETLRKAEDKLKDVPQRSTRSRSRSVHPVIEPSDGNPTKIEELVPKHESGTSQKN